MGKPYFKVSLEIFLLVCSSFAISYILHEGLNGLGKEVRTDENKKANSFIELYKILVDFALGDNNIVSALNVGDIINTCVKSKEGKLCQQYPASSCSALCAGDCLPLKVEDVAECKIGTCYDNVEGTCQIGSPKSSCLEQNGQWIDDALGNNLLCQQGCCVLGTNSELTTLTTAQQCNRKASVLGMSSQFKTNVRDALSCLNLASTQPEGACVFSSVSSTGKNSCKFIKQSDCLKLGGTFNLGSLCSKESFNTNCTQEASTNCYNGKVYWFDSCGNRENIFDINRVGSFNNGNVLTPDQSCQLTGTNGDSCGNCNYLLGTTCKLKRGFGGSNFVCQDLSCIDEKGNKRDNGESWCEYDSSIGLNDGGDKSTDTPGSRHFRKTCIDGEVKTEPCADYRNEICVEEKTNKNGGGSISSAACRTNIWQLCLNQNTDKANDKKCEDNPDCFTKAVNIGGEATNFQFNVCAPKYNPGFDTKDYSDSAKQVCSMGNAPACRVVFVKEFDVESLFSEGDGKWVCQANCGCLTDSFAQQLNDLCISLGDCGTKVNYNGDLSINGGVTKSGSAPIDDHTPTLTQSYLDELKKYSTPVDEKVAPPELNKYNAVLGAKTDSGNITDPSDLGMMGTIMPGLVGIAGLMAAKTLSATAVAAFTKTGAAASSAIGTSGALAGASGALAGAAIGFAVTSMLIKYTGIGSGIGEEMTYALIGMGTAAGAVIGANAALTGTALGGQIGASGGLLGGGLSGAVPLFGMLATIAWIVVIVVIAIVVAMYVMGIGDSQEVSVQYSCQPWQAPSGGASCNQCGKNGLPCSRYSCHQLGQACEFVNEGTGKEACVNVAPKDVTAPAISFLASSLASGFISRNDGTKTIIEGTGNEKCATAFTALTFGVSINEAAQCRMDSDPTKKFDDMRYDFGGDNLYLYNHTMSFVVPSLESLGIPSMGLDISGNISLYVKCKDYNGNKNENPFGIGFCIKPGKDISEPVIVSKTPSSGTIAYNATSQNVSLFLNEPSNCRWALADYSYDAMSNNFTCKTGYGDARAFGWPCSTELPIASKDNKFYFRCADQPWFVGTNESLRNKNSKSYEMTLSRTSSNLNIDSINVDNLTITSGSIPVSVEVIAKTSGGYDGKAECSFSLNGLSFVDFYNTFSNSHSQVFGLASGEDEIVVRCSDFVGNTAQKTARFKVSVDNLPPVVTRIYRSSSDLVAVTNENAVCAYSNMSVGSSGCNFGFENVSLMSGNQLIHTVKFNQNVIYYIKCKDSFGNQLEGCNMIAGGGNIR